MKKVLFYGLLLSFGVTSSNAQQLKSLTKIEVGGDFSNPVVAPNGKLALVTTNHASGVFLLNLQTQKLQQISDKEGSGYGYSWNKNSQEFYFKQKNEGDFYADSKTYSYNLESQKVTELQEINHNFLPSFSGYDKADASNVVVSLTLKRLNFMQKI